MTNKPNASMEGSDARKDIPNAEIGNGKPYAFDEKDVLDWLYCDAESIRKGTEAENSLLRQVLGDGVFEIIRDCDAPMGRYEITAHAKTEGEGLSGHSDKNI
jgi:hypothetical protein